MNEPQQSFDKALKIMVGLGVLLPFLVASYTCQLLCTNLLEKVLTFSAVFLFVFLIFWIVARTLMQFLDE